MILRFTILYMILMLLVSSGCSEYNKILKSSDYPKKYEASLKYYEKGQFDRALALMEELMTAYRGTDKAEKLAYYIAYCNYNLGYYELASFYFKNFARTFPTNTHAEECAYMTAYCFYLTSPIYSLDQSDTKSAIREFQMFINQYSGNDRPMADINFRKKVEVSRTMIDAIIRLNELAGFKTTANAFSMQREALPVNRIEKANEIVQKLRDKLERKNYENAKQYYNLGEYQAAVVAFQNMLKDYPDTKYKEEVSFLTVKSSYLLAINSIEKKKQERFSAAMDFALKFSTSFPNSDKKDAASGIYENALRQKQKLQNQNKP